MKLCFSTKSSWLFPVITIIVLSLDVKDILKNSKNSEELAHIWLAWRRNTGRKMRKSYEDLVPLLNKAAAANGR